MSDKKYYTAGIVYNDDTIRQLFRAEYYTYERLWVVLRMCAGFAMAAAGVMGHMGTVLTVILLLIGCWLLASPDFPSKVRAEGLIRQRHGGTSRVDFTFYEETVRLRGYERTYSYKSADRLVETDRYLFIFYSRQDALMVDKSSIKPADTGEFMHFISERSGRRWQGTSFLMMNLKDLIQMIRDQYNK